MAVTQLLKKVKRSLKAVLMKVNRLANSFRYLFRKPIVTSEMSKEAHLLVVKKNIYAPIAKICIESFLHFHPRSWVVVHVDSITADDVSKKLKRAIARGKVKILRIDNENLPWQELKLGLILALGDEQKFFMDADLKWNGPMPSISNITLFVNEFKFRHNPFYSPLFDNKYFERYFDFSMKNTSFFYWGNHTPKKNYEFLIHEIMNEVLTATDNSSNSEEFNSSTRRISEQIALSLLVESTGEEVDFLKQSDGFKDGSFVESSYFGATGSSF